jgi:hypothetical protein
MNQTCPTSGVTADENKARLIALFIAVLTFLFWYTHQLFILSFINLDFFLRGFLSPKDSLLKNIVDFLSKKLRIKEHKIDYAQKAFAAKAGFFITLSIASFAIFGISNLVEGFTFLLIGFALLEAVLGICVGCYLYNVIVYIQEKVE